MLATQTEPTLDFFTPSELSFWKGQSSLHPRPMPSHLRGLRVALGLSEPERGKSTGALTLEHQQQTQAKNLYQGSTQKFNYTTNAWEIDPSKVSWGKSVLVLGRQSLQGSGAQVFLYQYQFNNEPITMQPNLKGVTVVAVEQVKFRHNRNSGWYNRDLPENWDEKNTLAVQIEYQGEKLWLFTTILFAEMVFGIQINREGNFALGDQTFGAAPAMSFWKPEYVNEDHLDFTLEALGDFRELRVGTESYNNLLHAEAMRGNFTPTDKLHKPGLTKLYKDVLAPLTQELFDQGEYRAWSAMRSCFLEGGKSIRKIKVSTVINAEFANVTTAEELKAKLAVFETMHWSEAIESFEFFTTKRKETVRKDTDRAIRKRVQDVEEIDLDAKLYPLTHEAIINGEIPLTCLFPNQETYFLTNDNWQLWEDMLRRFPEETKKCAVEAGARRHYERDLMSYFYFILYGLPEYLEKQTGYTWTCSPRLVESQYELEPQAVSEDRGVTKMRSALTPVADNVKHHVVVPYCSMAVHGAMTTYCYAHSYHVLTRGMVFDGNVVVKNVEEKLNGKDDYGLMFYTLTGSYTNRGYPTFLIIFERLKRGKKTRVHFHRVHPMRSKDGDRNPVSNWTKVAYNWMIGNVNKDSIAFQQGDLAFIQVPADKAYKFDFTNAPTVTDCDSHCFARGIPFLAYEGKEKHILGHIRIDSTKDLTLNHPEHDNVQIRDEGIFEIRQARSWEANPKGVWTLNID